MFWAKWTETTGNARDIIQLGKNSIKCAVSTGYNSYGQDKVAFGNTHTITGYQTWRYNAGTGLNDGNWHHIAVTKSGTDTVTIYVDGTTRPYYADGLRYYTNYNYMSIPNTNIINCKTRSPISIIVMIKCYFYITLSGISS